ncbi:hypothetical protein AAG570_009235 [Ranatra chinensis]|uniref:Ribosomal protein S3 n=1 Tax=Ranatra chinensis TaxID=642074 RepID=A0ABD0YT51_9HEMI
MTLTRWLRNVNDHWGPGGGSENARHPLGFYLDSPIQERESAPGFGHVIKSPNNKPFLSYHPKVCWGIGRARLGRRTSSGVERPGGLLIGSTRRRRALPNFTAKLHPPVDPHTGLLLSHSLSVSRAMSLPSFPPTDPFIPSPRNACGRIAPEEIGTFGECRTPRLSISGNRKLIGSERYQSGDLLIVHLEWRKQIALLGRKVALFEVYLKRRRNKDRAGLLGNGNGGGGEGGLELRPRAEGRQSLEERLERADKKVFFSGVEGRSFPPGVSVLQEKVHRPALGPAWPTLLPVESDFCPTQPQRPIRHFDCGGLEFLEEGSRSRSSERPGSASPATKTSRPAVVVDRHEVAPLRNLEKGVWTWPTMGEDIVGAGHGQEKSPFKFKAGRLSRPA